MKKRSNYANKWRQDPNQQQASPGGIRAERIVEDPDRIQKRELRHSDASGSDRHQGKIADTINEILELNQKMVSEFARISQAVGKEGKITQRASIGSVTGAWTECMDSVNSLIGDLVQPSTEVARVIGAVAKGDLSQTMALEVDGRPLRGEFLHTARVVNTMVDQLNSFASEVTRVAREVGTEGKLGGQADVRAWPEPGRI